MSFAKGILAIVDLPAGSILSVDGQSVAIKRSDFVGLKSIPTEDGRFHLVTIRAGASRSSNGTQLPNPSATTVGFSLGHQEESALIRRFDSLTEEVSSLPVDETTRSNLLRQIQANQLGPERVVPYDNLVPSQQAEFWRIRTSYVSRELLVKRGIEPGAKLVPGSLDEDSSSHEDDGLSTPTSRIVDGTAVRYPSIPAVISRSGGVRHTRHAGTKRFIAKLTASQRTALFTSANPSKQALELVLKQYYNNVWGDVLGDVQLAFLLFTHLHCFSSLCHWRDLVALLAEIDIEGAAAWSQMYSTLLDVLSSQLEAVDQDFFEDAYFADDNFLLPSLHRLTSTLSRVVDQEVTVALSRFQGFIERQFSSQCQDETPTSPEEVESSVNSDKDGPVIVPSEEVEASLTRSNADRKSYGAVEPVPPAIRLRFPFLFAAMMPNEDIVMTCARALDEAADVSLVREAAAYLEQIESQPR